MLMTSMPDTGTILETIIAGEMSINVEVARFSLVRRGRRAKIRKPRIVVRQLSLHVTSLSDTYLPFRADRSKWWCLDGMWLCLREGVRKQREVLPEPAQKPAKTDSK